MKIDDDGRLFGYSIFNEFGCFVANDFLHVAMVCRSRDGTQKFRFDFILPAVIDADADDVHFEIADELIIFVEDARNRQKPLVCEVFLFFHDGRGHTVVAFADDAAANGCESILYFVCVGIEHDRLSFVDNLSHHALARVFGELFVQRQAAVIAMNRNEDLRRNEFDEELEFALIAVPGAVQREFGTIDQRSTLLVKAVDNRRHAAFIARNLARRIDEHVSGDMLIYSARQIPGNERRVATIINGFYQQGASLVDRPELSLHSSGHGNQRELELLIELIAPQIFVPIHGDHRRLSLHEQLAKNTGERMVTEIIDEGQSIVLYPDTYEIQDTFAPVRRCVVGKCYDGMTPAIMKEKKNLAHQGLLTVSGVLNENDELVGDLKVHIVGICVNDGWQDEIEPELLRTISTSAHHGDMEEIIRHKAAKLVKNAVAKQPTVIVDFHRV